MMWDYDSYSSDDFVQEYSKLYFGEENAVAIAQLYADYYDAYWEPKESEFTGLKRQFLFQDLRYARVFDQVYPQFFSSPTPNLNPLRESATNELPDVAFVLI